MPQTKPILTAIFLLPVLILSAQGQPRKAVADKIVTVVGDRIILYSDIRQAMEEARLPDGTLPQDAVCRVMEQVLVSKVLTLQAEKDSLPVTEEDVEAELDQRIRYFIKELGSVKVLEEYAGKPVYQIKEDARTTVKERQLALAMQRRITSIVRITPAEVKTFFDRIPPDSLPFFESELELGQIVVFPKPSPELEQYTLSEMNNYKRQAESRSVSFEQLAQRYSEYNGIAKEDKGSPYPVSRNEKSRGSAFISVIFKLQEGAISTPVKTQNGYYLVQLLQKNGDEAIIRHLFRRAPVTSIEINQSTAKLDSIRSKIIEGTLGFNEAAKKYSEDESVKYAGPYFLNQYGAPYVTIDQLDKETVKAIGSLQTGDYSHPVAFTDDQGRKGLKMLYLRSRSTPHRMNLRDDYSKIAEAALERKKLEALNKWVMDRLTAYAITLDEETAAECETLARSVQQIPKKF